MSRQEEIERIVKEVRHIPVAQLTKLFAEHSNFTVLPEGTLAKVLSEVTRLWTPCDRTIDLRYKIDELKVERVDIDGITHFLDRASLKVLERETKLYKGLYTIGAYDAVKRFFENNKNTLLVEQQILERDVQVVRFGRAAQRAEERMNLAISATLFQLSDFELYPKYVPDEDSLGKQHQIVTSNISHTGLKIRCKHMLEKDELAAIRFDDLEKELIFKQKLVTYRVIKSIYNNKLKMFDCMLKLEEIDANEEFKSYTKNLIYSHKYKYKVDLDSILEASLTKGYEQYSVDRTNSIDVFLNKDEKITHVFTNHHSEPLISAFEIESQSYLQALLEKDQVIKHLKQHHSCYFFITRVKMNTSQQVAFLSTVVDSNEQSLALVQHFCNGKTARLFRLTLQEVDEEQASKRSTIPSEAQDSFGSNRVHRFSKQALALISEDKHVLTIVPVMEEMLDKIKWSENSYKALPHHILSPSVANVSKISHILAETDDNRGEDRFVFSSPVTISYKSNEFKGKIVNISSLGLACEMLDNRKLEPDTLVNVCFDEYVDRTTLYSLNRCKYRVIYSDGKSLRLSNEHMGDHDGRAFLQRLILAKLDELKLLDRENEVYGLNRLLRNLSSAITPNYIMFTQVFKGKIALCGVSVPQNRTSEISSEEARNLFKDNLKTWFYEPDLLDILRTEFLKNKTLDTEKTAIVVLSFKIVEGKGRLFKANILTEDTMDNNALLNLIRIAGMKGRVARVFELKISKTAKEFKRYYLDELSYIKRYAPHKYNLLRKQITEVNGLIQATELTDLLRSLVKN